MRFLKLRARNFGPYKKLEFPLDGAGVVFVQGENTDYGGDSNGAGKSMALTEALSWTLFGTTTRGETKIQRGGSDYAQVSVLARRAGKKVQVTRYDGHKRYRLRLWHDGKEITTKEVRETQKAVLGLLGASRDAFLYTTIFGQGLACRFSSLRDADRAVLLEEILGSSVWESARESARAQVRELAQERSEAAARQAEVDAKVEESSVVLAAAKRESQKAKRESEASRIKLRSRISVLDSALAAHEDRLKLQKADVGEKAATVAAAEEELRQMAEDIAKYTMELAPLKSRLAQAARDGVRLDGKATCPTCGQTVGQEALERVHESAANEEERLSQAIHKVSSRLKRAEKAAKEQKSALELAVDHLAAARERAQATELRVTKADAERQALEDQIEQRSDTGTELVIQKLSDQIKKAKEDSRTLAGKQTELTEAASYSEWWVDGFQRLRADRFSDAVRFLNHRLREYCSVLCPKDLGAYLTVESKKTGSGLGTKISLEVTTEGRSYRSASGGEKDRIDLAVAFALHDLAQAASGFAANLLVADEVGTHLDGQGVEAAVSLLRRKAEGGVSSLFITSQSESWARHFRNSWTVRRRGGVSELIQKG